MSDALAARERRRSTGRRRDGPGGRGAGRPPGAGRLMVFDADGVLTTGTLIYGPDGEALKEFHSHDGLGLVMARIAGLKLAVLTGRDSAIVARRCARTALRRRSSWAVSTRLAALAEILAETGVRGRSAPSTWATT